MHPLISIVVPVFNQAGVTVNCFHSLRMNTKIPYELIWVDNGSKKDEYEIILRQAKLTKNCKIIRNKQNLGFVKATNQGINLAKGKYIILLNNDTEVFTGWESDLIYPLEKGACSVVGPLTDSKIAWQTAKYVNSVWNTSVPEYVFGERKLYPRKLEKYHYKYIDITKEKLNLAFFCAAIPKSVLDAIGVLCEEFTIGLGDDDEYCARLRSMGHKLFLSLGSFVKHYHRTTFTAMGIGEDSLRQYNKKILSKKLSQYKKLGSTSS